MDIISNIKMAVLNQVEGAKVLPYNNGGIEVQVEDSQDCAAVIACAADMLYDYGGDDIQITTNQKQLKVFIDVLELDEEDDDYCGEK